MGGLVRPSVRQSVRACVRAYGERARCAVLTRVLGQAGGGSKLSNLVSVPITPQSLPNAVVTIVLDLSQVRGGHALPPSLDHLC